MSSVSKIVKTGHNPLLWTQILPLPRVSSEGSSKALSPEDKLIPVSAPKERSQFIPIMPENKNNASLRMILHDTKTTLDQFSDRLGTLVKGVEQAKREIDAVTMMFTEGNDKLLGEVNAVVNRSQRGLLETLGSPAQASALEEVKRSQSASDRKLDSLEGRTEMMQKQLQAISEQQGHILTSLAAVTPLAPILKDLPSQQTQIISSLGGITPLLSFLNSLPDQLKASQQETLEKFTASVDLIRARSYPSPSAKMPMSRNGKHPGKCTPESGEGLALKRKHPTWDLTEDERQKPVEDARLLGFKPQLDHIQPSSRRLCSGSPRSVPFRMKANVPFVSGHSDSLYKLSSSSGTRDDIPQIALKPGNLTHGYSRDPKRPRLDTTSTSDVELGDVKATDTSQAENPVAPSCWTPDNQRFRYHPEDTSERAFPGSKVFHRSRLCLGASRAFRVPASPNRGSGLASFGQSRRLSGESQREVPLEATPQALSHTPTPPEHDIKKRRPTTRSQTLVPRHSASTLSDPPFALGRLAAERVQPPSSMNTGSKGISPKKPQTYIASARKQLPRRAGQRILFDDNVDENSEAD